MYMLAKDLQGPEQLGVQSWQQEGLSNQQQRRQLE